MEQIIPWDRLDIQWVNDWYDGYLSLIAFLDGQHVYVHYEDAREEGDREVRVYGVYRLTPEQQAAEVERHEEFVRLVSGCWDYRLPPEERVVRPDATHARFYERHPPGDRHDLSLATRVGTTEW